MIPTNTRPLTRREIVVQSFAPTKDHVRTDAHYVSNISYQVAQISGNEPVGVVGLLIGLLLAIEVWRIQKDKITGLDYGQGTPKVGPSDGHMLQERGGAHDVL